MRLRQELTAVCAENDLLRKERGEIAGLIAEGIGMVTDALVRFRAPAGAPLVATDAAPPREEPVAPSPRRVLVVDDNPNFRNMITEYLAGNRGYDVRVAASGEEALPLVPDFRPQVVLLDVRMPGIGGMGTLQQIRALYPDLAVVMVTGDEDLGLTRKALALGAADYVTKPFDLDHLDAVLTIYLAGSEASQRAAPPARRVDGDAGGR
jgi:CheY-like chemotaxis protein